MKTRYIFGIITFIGLFLSSVGCSDNVDNKLEALSVDKFLEIYINGSNASKLNLSAASSLTTIEVKSNLKWEVSLVGCEGGWCKVEPSNNRGNATFTITVEENGLKARECVVTVYSIDTQRIKKLEIQVVQQPVSEETARPTVMQPSIIGEPGQTGASIQFNYDSPFYEVRGAGVEYKKEGDDNWTKQTASAGNVKDKNISVVLNGLVYGTTYIVRGFVEYEKDGEIKIQYSSANLTFTTAGETPGGNDNPPPSVP